MKTAKGMGTHKPREVQVARMQMADKRARERLPCAWRSLHLPASGTSVSDLEIQRDQPLPRVGNLLPCSLMVQPSSFFDISADPSPSLVRLAQRVQSRGGSASTGDVPSKRRFRTRVFGRATVVHADCMEWLRQQERSSIHAVVTDPPYGLVEYSSREQEKLRNGKGGVWRQPPSFDGARRSPLPRFTVLSPGDVRGLGGFFSRWARLLAPVLAPGANVVVAANPLLSHVVAGALAEVGLERRGEIVRLVMTMRGGDRPKGAHDEFPDVSVMPRSMWEPWLVFRKPLEGRVQDNLRRWRTGGFRRPSPDRPFGDVIRSSPTRKEERSLAPHPSLKPQGFLRPLVRGVLPLGEGVVLDPFCGAGSTLAAAEAVGYRSIGIESDPEYFDMACRAIPRLAIYRREQAELSAWRSRNPSDEASTATRHPG